MNVQVDIYQVILKLGYWRLAFTFFKKTRRGLELVSLPHFLDDFWRYMIYNIWFFYEKIFLTLYSINRPIFIDWLPLSFEILDNMFIIIIICCSACDVINVEIKLSFLINLLAQKCKYLKNEKSFLHEIKSIFISDKRADL